ncbi:helix-turn-helix domain-containing protein [uncultured Robinsoniella sp.]|uniref:helix-turn-helix domain-containing protein n=1 Tax=uncultured Robinsoniella sp. TaxID=904190 RepID=UPI00374E5DB9
MDCNKVGLLISELRKDKNMTQKEIADAMNISDKTISKWERGLGCPDVSLLSELSHILGVNIEKILQGDLDPNHTDGGNMKRVKFYLCPTCGNVLTSTAKAELSCCGRKLEPLVEKAADEHHIITAADIEDESYITVDHPMTREHYLTFAAYVTCDRLQLIKLYPEQNAELRIPKIRSGKFYICCSKHGLYAL